MKKRNLRGREDLESLPLQRKDTEGKKKKKKEKCSFIEEKKGQGEKQGEKFIAAKEEEEPEGTEGTEKRDEG